MAIQLKGNNTSTYSNDISSGTFNQSSTTVQGYLLSPAGVLNCQRAASSTSPIFLGYQGTTNTAEIKADGSATLATRLTVGVDTSTGNGTRIANNGTILQRKDTAGSCYELFNGGSGNGDRKIIFSADGSSSFAGRMDIGSSTHNTYGLTIDCSTSSALYVQNRQANGYVFEGVDAAQRRIGISQSGYMESIRDYGSGNFVVEINNGQAIQVSTGGSTKFRVDRSGNAVFSGSVTASNVSDIKFKENITDAKPQLSDVVILGSSLKNWDWKEDAPLNDEVKSRRFLGLIAQEAEETCPGITYEVANEGDTYKAINHDILVMKLLGAVAEQNARIEALEAQLTQLTGGAN